MSSYHMMSRMSKNTKESDEHRNIRLPFKRRRFSHVELSKALPIVHEVLQSPGRSLDKTIRTFMESRFGHDFSNVRVHTDERAAESAEALNALAYTVGHDIVFALGQYRSGETSGRRLLAHELTHVIQQNHEMNNDDVEKSANVAANLVAQNQRVNLESIGGAPLSLYKEEKDEEKKKPKPPLTKHAFYISPEELSKPVAFQLLQPSSTQKEEESAPELPSRLPVLGSGRFSLGLRLGFPEPEGEKLVGAPGTGMKEALRKGKLMNQIITGKVPTSWEALDKGKLAKAIWGIFSTKIAPDLARDITSNLSKSMGQPGVSYELDLVILTDFKGGGLSFTVRY